mgnify:CR=1 FL=1
MPADSVHGWIDSFAAGNWAVHVMSPSQKTRDALPGRVTAGLEKLGADKGLLKNLKMYDNLEAIPWADVDLVVEAATENIDLKRKLFSQLEALARPEEAEAILRDIVTAATEAERPDVAAEASLPAGSLRPVIERWTQDGDDGPAFLSTVSPERYTLAEAHEAIRRFLEEAGHLELEGSDAGKRSVRRKRDRLLGDTSK